MKPDGWGEKEQNSFPRKKNKKKRRNGVEGKKKEKKKKTLWMSGKVTGECTISYNSDLNPTKKKEREKEKSYTPMAVKLLIS